MLKINVAKVHAPKPTTFGLYTAAISAALLLAGCGTTQSGFTPPVSTSLSVSGSAFGGQQPVSGASVQLYAMNLSTIGGVSTPMLSKPVVTDNGGQFSITGTYACPSASAELYVVATGGNPGLGAAQTNNNAALLGLLGPCGNQTGSVVKLNEFTTVAAVSALAPFMKSYNQIGAGPADEPMLSAALNTANQLASFATGVTPGPAMLPGQEAQTEKLSTLANVLAACVNSIGGVAGDSTPCGNLFANAPGAQNPSTNTIDAMLSIAKNPTRSVSPLYMLTASSAPFHPALNAAPEDWSLTIPSATSSTSSAASAAPVTSAASLPATATHIAAPQVATQPAASMVTETAKQADSFVDSIGVNVHFSYYGSYYTKYVDQAILRLQQLGVRHLRDQMAWEGTYVSASPFYAAHNKIGALGIKTDYILTSMNTPMGEVQTYPSLVNDMEAAEASNEWDASGDAKWASNIRIQQNALYKQMKRSAATQAMTVVSPSLAGPYNASALGDLTSVSDVGDSHAYFGGWNPGNSGTGGANTPAYFLKQARTNNPTQPVWVTETGFWNSIGAYWGGHGVSEAAAGIYAPRALLEFWNAGATRTYLYELADYSSTVEFGLMRQNGSSRPSFNSIMYINSILSDRGAAFTPGSLTYALKGAGPNVHHAIFQKRNKSFYLAVWNEVPSYDFNKETMIDVPAQQVTLQLAGTPTSVQISQFQETTGAASTTTVTASQSVALTVTDKLQIIRLTMK